MFNYHVIVFRIYFDKVNKIIHMIYQYLTFNRQGNINDGTEQPLASTKTVFNPNTEFKEFSLKQLREYKKMFQK